MPEADGVVSQHLIEKFQASIVSSKGYRMAKQSTDFSAAINAPAGVRS